MYIQLTLFSVLALSAHFAEANIQADHANPLIAVEVIEDVLPFFDTEVHVNSVRLPTERDEFPPLRALLSKERYWAEDRHLDVVVQLSVDISGGYLAAKLVDGAGRELSAFKLDPVPGQNFAIYPLIPAALLQGGDGQLKLSWIEGNEVVADLTLPFRVERYNSVAPSTGRIQLDIPNPEAVVQGHLPFTVGVPLPRGLVYDSAHLRLIDGNGREVPVQIMETNRWSKYGSLRWILCDFTVDLDGAAKVLYLEYGPGVERAGGDAIGVTMTAGFPRVDAGRLRIDDGVWFDAQGDGNFRRVLGDAALNGAFVQHEHGGIHRIPVDDEYIVEEIGSEKVVIARRGWYVNDQDGSQFCKYIIRYVIHRDSPLIRIFQTFIYTGDDKQDRIRNMGWKFELDPALQPRGFLASFNEDPQWIPGDALLQWDYEHFRIVSGQTVEEFAGGRAAGVAWAGNGEVEFYFGAADFWQNYPSELEFHEDAFWFHSWPRNNVAAGHNFDKEWTPSPPRLSEDPGPLPSAARYAQEDPQLLTYAEWVLNVLQHRYAHEGVLLDFALPERFSQPPLSRSPDGHNAQGIARTEEMWLYFRAADHTGPDTATPLLRGLAEETLRAVVDPVWLAASEAIPGIHHQDWEQFPEQERSYELAALSYGVIAEHLGMYGMWIYGDLPLWGPNLGTRTPRMNRSFQKQHLGWPYSWVPYARSGDSRLLKTAQANSRRVMDSGYSHYVSEELSDQRSPGYWGIGPVYWGGETHTRGVWLTVENLIHAWALTGYHRAQDHLMFVTDTLKNNPIDRALHGRGDYNRASNAELKTYVDLYEQTFDPWFMVAAHALSRGHMYGRTRELIDGVYGGRIWETGDGSFLKFTGDSDFRDRLYLDRIIPVSVNEFEPTHYNRRHPQYTTTADAWALTGDDYYLRRASAAVQAGTFLIGDGERYPPYLQGYINRSNNPSRASGGATDYTVFTSRHLKWFPIALRAVADAGYWPDPIVDSFMVNPPVGLVNSVSITVYKDSSEEPLPVSLRAWTGHFAPAPFPDTIKVEYRIFDHQGDEVAAGVWDYGDRSAANPINARHINAQKFEIPAGFPAGAYTIEFVFPKTSPGGYTAAGRLAVPITAGDTPEVFVLGEGAPMYTSDLGTYWFMVPEGVEQFWIDFRRDAGGLTMVWDPDGRRVWNQGDHYPVESLPDEPRMVRAEFSVPPEHAGQLWKVSGVGRFVVDPQIPPIFSVEPRRWFDPGAATGAGD